MNSSIQVDLQFSYSVRQKLERSRSNIQIFARKVRPLPVLSTNLHVKEANSNYAHSSI